MNDGPLNLNSSRSHDPYHFYSVKNWAFNLFGYVMSVSAAAWRQKFVGTGRIFFLLQSCSDLFRGHKRGIKLEKHKICWKFELKNYIKSQNKISY